MIRQTVCRVDSTSPTLTNVRLSTDGFADRPGPISDSRSCPFLTLSLELLLEIFSYGSKTDWLSIVRSHRFFQSAAREHLYQHISIEERPDWQSFSSHPSRLELLHASLSAQPNLGRLVKHLTLHPVLYSYVSPQSLQQSHPDQPGMRQRLLMARSCIQQQMTQTNEFDMVADILQWVPNLVRLRSRFLSFAGTHKADPKRTISQDYDMRQFPPPGSLPKLQVWHIDASYISLGWFQLPALRVVSIGGSCHIPLLALQSSPSRLNRVSTLTCVCSHRTWSFLMPNQFPAFQPVKLLLPSLSQLTHLYIEIDLSKWRNGDWINSVGYNWIEGDHRLEATGRFDVLLGQSNIPDVVAARLRTLSIKLAHGHNPFLLSYIRPLGSSRANPADSLSRFTSLRALTLPFEAIVLRDSRTRTAPLSDIFPDWLEKLSIYRPDYCIADLIFVDVLGQKIPSRLKTICFYSDLCEWDSSLPDLMRHVHKDAEATIAAAGISLESYALSEILNGCLGSS